MWWRDLASMLEQAGEWETQSARDSENLAMLVDRDDYWLNSEYASWTSDPDDPEAKRERARRKRDGIKPPPLPILPPVAMRPPELAAKRAEQYRGAMPKPAPVGADKVSVRELAALLKWG